MSRSRRSRREIIAGALLLVIGVALLVTSGVTTLVVFASLADVLAVGGFGGAMIGVIGFFLLAKGMDW